MNYKFIRNNNLIFVGNMILKNENNSSRVIRVYKDKSDIEYRYNEKYEVYISADGKILDINFAPVQKYKTISNSGRSYWAFNCEKERRIYLHRAVAYLYVTGYGKELVVDHIDNDPFNCHAENLQYLTSSENIKKDKHGKQMIVKNTDTEEVLTFDSKKEFCEYFEITTAALWHMLKNLNKADALSYFMTLVNVLVGYEINGIENQKAEKTIYNVMDFINHYEIISVEN